MGIVRGILSNGLANIVQKLVRIADQLLLVPFFLTHWGAATYGEWLTLTIIPSVLAFSDLGLGAAVGNSFTLAYAAGDKQKAADIKRSGFLIVTLSIALGVLISVIAMVVFVQTGVFDNSCIKPDDAAFALILMMAARLFSFYNQFADGYFRAARRAALGTFIMSGMNLLGVIVGIIVLQLGFGVVAFALSQFFSFVTLTSLSLFIGNRMISLDGYKGKIKRDDIVTMTKKGIGFMMDPIWRCIYFQGTTFAVRLALGAESVAVFNTVRTVCRSVSQIFYVINASIFPDLQYEYGCGNISAVHKFFRISVIVSLAIGVCGFVVLSIWGLDIYDWWTHSLLTVPRNVWTVFLIGVLFNAVWWTSSVAYRITNKPFHFAIVSTSMAAVSVLLTYFLAVEWGLWGAALGNVVFEIILAVIILPDSCKLLNMKLVELLINAKSDFLEVTSFFFKRTQKRNI